MQSSVPNKRFTVEEDINIATSTYRSSLFQLVAQEEQSLECLQQSSQPWGWDAICGCLICKQGHRRFVKLIHRCLIYLDGKLETVLWWDRTSRDARQHVDVLLSHYCVVSWVLSPHGLEHTHIQTWPSFWSAPVSWLYLVQLWCYCVDKICPQTYKHLPESSKPPL